jgi:hypothetical protein
MSKLRLSVPAVASLFAVSTTRAGFADAVISYDLGSGFAGSFTNVSTVLGAPTVSANPFSPAFRNTQLLSIGAGGYLTVQSEIDGFAAVPEPSTMDLALLATAAVAATRWALRRRQR